MVHKVGLSVELIRPNVLPMCLSQSLIYVLENCLGSYVAYWGFTQKVFYAACYIPSIIMALIGDWHAIELVASIKAD